LKKNIIFFLPNFEFGGASKSICNTIINLNKRKYNLYVYCLNKCRYKKLLKKSNVKVLEIKSKKTGGYLAFNDLAPYFCSPKSKKGLVWVMV
jgi:hypothetical protein